jgi:hypothetical protein
MPAPMQAFGDDAVHLPSRRQSGVGNGTHQAFGRAAIHYRYARTCERQAEPARILKILF